MFVDWFAPYSGLNCLKWNVKIFVDWLRIIFALLRGFWLDWCFVELVLNFVFNHLQLLLLFFFGFLNISCVLSRNFIFIWPLFTVVSIIFYTWKLKPFKDMHFVVHLDESLGFRHTLPEVIISHWVAFNNWKLQYVLVPPHCYLFRCFSL